MTEKKSRRSPTRRHVQGICISCKGERAHGKACHLRETLGLAVLVELGLRDGDLHHSARSEGVPDSLTMRGEFG